MKPETEREKLLRELSTALLAGILAGEGGSAHAPIQAVVLAENLLDVLESSGALAALRSVRGHRADASDADKRASCARGSGHEPEGE